MLPHCWCLVFPARRPTTQVCLAGLSRQIRRLPSATAGRCVQFGNPSRRHWDAHAQGRRARLAWDLRRAATLREREVPLAPPFTGADADRPGNAPKVPAGAWADRRLKACYEYVIACDAGAAGAAVRFHTFRNADAVSLVKAVEVPGRPVGRVIWPSGTVARSSATRAGADRSVLCAWQVSQAVLNSLRGPLQEIVNVDPVAEDRIDLFHWPALEQDV